MCMCTRVCMCVRPTDCGDMRRHAMVAVWGQRDRRKGPPSRYLPFHPRRPFVLPKRIGRLPERWHGQVIQVPPR